MLIKDTERAKAIVNRIAGIGEEIAKLNEEAKQLRGELGVSLGGSLPMQFLVGNRLWNISKAQIGGDFTVSFTNYERVD